MSWPYHKSSAHLLDRQVDAVIVVCSSYVPVPSVSAAVVNHFKMKSSVLAYNLSGQGCAASIISVDLAKELLQVCISCKPCASFVAEEPDHPILGSFLPLCVRNRHNFALHRHDPHSIPEQTNP